MCDWWHYEDKAIPQTRLSAAVGFDRDDVKITAITYEEMRKGCWDPQARLEDMDANWTEAQMCFPSFPRFCGQTFLEAEDMDLALLCVKAYNDWMVDEWCGDSNGRLIPLIIIPLWDAAAGRRGGPPQRGAGGARHLLLRDPAVPGPALHPLGGVGPVLRGLRRDRRGRQHAHRLVVQDAVDLGRRPAGGGLDPDLRQRHVLDGRLPDVGRAGALPRPDPGLQRGPDRLDPLHPRAGRQGVGGQPGLERRVRQDPRAAFDLLLPPDLRLLLRRRPRPHARRAREVRGGQHHLRDRLPPQRQHLAPQPGGGPEADGPPRRRGGQQAGAGQRHPHAEPPVRSRDHHCGTRPPPSAPIPTPPISCSSGASGSTPATAPTRSSTRPPRRWWATRPTPARPTPRPRPRPRPTPSRRGRAPLPRSGPPSWSGRPTCSTSATPSSSRWCRPRRGPPCG